MRLLSSLRAASGIRQERVRSPPAPMLALSIRAIRAAVWNDVSSTRTSGAAGRRQPRVSPRSAARDRIPAQPRLSGRRRGSLSLQPLDHHRLEQRREARLRVRPRQGSCWTPCSVPRIPGTAEPHQRSVQHRVQMPPRPGGGAAVGTQDTQCRTSGRRASRRLVSFIRPVYCLKAGPIRRPAPAQRWSERRVAHRAEV